MRAEGCLLLRWICEESGRWKVAGRGVVDDVKTLNDFVIFGLNERGRCHGEIGK